ncbi:flagellin [Sporomusa sp.]|uniref:flagellin n=1 Tax=Sporomusa sp. TaxID=2078658 RepID=UPI002BF811D1|nr:flagellin [Sporomusa sp.]HWR43725.1 flagellin [Sporomusa sp.]
MSLISLNISSMDYQSSKSQTAYSTATNRLTSGLRISSDGTDDAAGLVVNEKNKSTTDDLNKRIGPAYSVELSSNQNATVSLQNQSSRLSESESRILDADVAAEAANLVNLQTSQQSGIAALAQSNSAPKALLSLLRG